MDFSRPKLGNMSINGLFKKNIAVGFMKFSPYFAKTQTNNTLISELLFSSSASCFIISNV